MRWALSPTTRQRAALPGHPSPRLVWANSCSTRPSEPPSEAAPWESEERGLVEVTSEIEKEDQFMDVRDIAQVRSVIEAAPTDAAAAAAEA
jgi:hypothetical protein